MYPSMKAELAARDGDLRLCLLLGLAAWFLFLDHVPHNAVSPLTMRNFGFSGATDLFVFVGGYTAAILYGRMMLERGFVVTATRIFKRLWQLYVAYVVLFVVYIDLIGYVARKSRASELIGEFNVTGIVDHTIRTLIHGLLLQAKPLNLDVLQLFIVLMAFFPFVLLGMMRRPNLTMAASISPLLRRPSSRLEPVFVSGRTLVLESVFLAVAVCARRLACLDRRPAEARHTRAPGFPDPARCGVAVSDICAGRDDGRKIPAMPGSFRISCSTLFFPTRRKISLLTGYFIFSHWHFSLLTWCRETGVDSDGRPCSRSSSAARNGYRSSAPASFFRLPRISS